MRNEVTVSYRRAFPSCFHLHIRQRALLPQKKLTDLKKKKEKFLSRHSPIYETVSFRRHVYTPRQLKLDYVHVDHRIKTDTVYNCSQTCFYFELNYYL